MDAPFLNALAADSEPITCGVPSTTASSLTTLGTALPPGGHGLVGFTSWIPETNRLLNALRSGRQGRPAHLAAAPHRLRPRESAGGRDVRREQAEFERSGLTQAGQRGAAYVGADYAGERIASTVACASVPGSLTYVYSGELDATGHRHGCESPEWRYQLQTVDAFCAALSLGLPDGVGLLVTADHGMVDVALDERVDVDEHPALQQGGVCSAVRHGSGMSTAGTARRTRYSPAGATSSATASWSTAETTPSTSAGSARSTTSHANGSAMYSPRASPGPRSSPRCASRTRRGWSVCTARSPLTRCSSRCSRPVGSRDADQTA